MQRWAGLAVLFVALLAALVGTVYVTSMASKMDEEVTAAEARRYRSFLLADELRQSSDDLTRMARTFVVTGDNRFEDHFHDILAIRDGRAPRPIDYSGIYWDFVTATGETPQLAGEAIALEGLMRDAGFSDDEFTLLRKAKADSDALVAIEERAMHAVKGLFSDADGAYTVSDEPDFELARELMHGPEYHRAKADIMAPIGEFLRLVDARTAAEVSGLRQRRTGLRNLAYALLVTTAVLVSAALILGLWQAAKAGRGPTADAAQPRSEGTVAAAVSVRSAWPIALAAVMVAAVIAVLAWWNEARMEQQRRADVATELSNVLSSTSQGVRYWIANREDEARIWANLNEVRSSYLALDRARSEGRSLRDSPAQGVLGETFSPLLHDRSYEGFLLVSPKGLVLAADRSGLIGEPVGDLLAEGLIERLLDGPRHAAVQLPLRSRSDTLEDGRPGARMFVMAAVRDSGVSLGALALEIDPQTQFSEILNRRRFGKSGESYAFNRLGQFISESRFNEQLRDIGLLRPGEGSILNLEIRDPGRNLLEGGDTPETRAERPLTLMARNAVAGQKGMDLDGYNDYRGVTVIGAWLWDAADGYGIATEIDAEEAYSSMQASRRAAFIAAALSVGLVVALTGMFLWTRVRMAKAQAELQALVERVQRQATELENVPTIILRWGPDGTILFANDYGSEVFGYSSEELVGKSLIGTVIGDRKDTRQNVRRMAEEIASNPEKYESDEVENIRRNGEPMWVTWRNKPIVNDDGSLREILTIGIDITRRKLIEQQIKQQKELLENTLESLTHPFYVVDAEDYSIKVANSAARKLGLFGESTCHALTHKSETPCDGRDDPCPLVEVKKTRQPVTVEHVHYDTDGNARIAEVHGYPIFDSDGKVVQMIEYSLDITDRKTLELQLEEAKDAAESANRAKSTFLANMSHELRTPMNAIIGYSELLAEDAEDEGHDEMIPDLGKISAAGKHLLALINDILDLSKIEAGRMDLYLERFELRQVLDEAVSTIAPLISEKGNRLVTEFGDGLGSIRADLTKLRQALFNLLSNAAKFAEGGSITLAASRETRDGADWITLSVSDTGIGIKQDKLEQVFEEFSQADASTTRDFGGTGLGLPISRRFCRMMGGDITVTSELGVGSTFTIELPAAVDALDAAKASARVDRPEPEEVRSGVRPILVIDDDPDSQDLLMRTLEDEGYVVVTASSGEEGLELARNLKPSLITLDVMMPGMDGWAVLERLKADPDLRHVPVMIVSMIGERDLGYTLGAVEYLTKPVDRDKLRQFVNLYAEKSGDGHALVVDDDENIRSLFRRALEEDGWTVAEAENGSLALDRVAEKAPDLVLLDLMMPVMDGFEFVLHFRSRDGCSATPIIVVTARDLTDEERQRLVGGVERIVEKGALTRRQLLDQVRDLVIRHGVATHDGETTVSKER